MSSSSATSGEDSDSSTSTSESIRAQSRPRPMSSDNQPPSDNPSGRQTRSGTGSLPPPIDRLGVGVQKNIEFFEEQSFMASDDPSKSDSKKEATKKQAEGDPTGSSTEQVTSFQYQVPPQAANVTGQATNVSGHAPGVPILTQEMINEVAQQILSSFPSSLRYPSASHWSSSQPPQNPPTPAQQQQQTNDDVFRENVSLDTLSKRAKQKHSIIVKWQDRLMEREVLLDQELSETKLRHFVLMFNDYKPLWENFNSLIQHFFEIDPNGEPPAGINWERALNNHIALYDSFMGRKAQLETILFERAPSSSSSEATLKAATAAASAAAEAAKAVSSKQSSSQDAPDPIHKSLELPRLKFFDYNGDPKEYLHFYEFYKQHLIANDQYSDLVKHQVLRSHLKGTAKSAVAGFPIVGENLQAVWKELQRRFGDETSIIGSCLNSIVNLNDISTSSSSSTLQKWIDTVNSNRRSLQEMKQVVLDDDVLWVTTLTKKLDVELLSQIRLWLRRAGEPKISEILEFLEYRVKSLKQTEKSSKSDKKSPPTASGLSNQDSKDKDKKSSDSKSKSKDKKDKQSKSSKKKDGKSKKDGSSGKGSSQKKSSSSPSKSSSKGKVPTDFQCPFCMEKGDHYPRFCKSIIGKSPEDRLKQVVGKFCQKCLYKYHGSSPCNKEISCKSSNCKQPKTHNTLLHDPKRHE